MRILGRVRLSRFHDESTSVVRQKADIERWAQAFGHEVIGYAVDVDVSRSVSPFDAPDLGPYLNQPERVASYDAVVSYRLDRLATGSIQLNDLIKWAQDHAKVIVSVSEGFDLGTPTGRMMANLIAGISEGELEAIRERTANAFTYNWIKGKYTGGAIPYGYTVEQTDDGWRFVPDLETALTLTDIVDRVISGESVRSIRIDLNHKGVPTPADAQRKRSGNPVVNAKWSDPVLLSILKSEALLGYAMRRKAITGPDGRPVRNAKGKKKFEPEPTVVRDETGAPVQRAKPLITRERFDELQAALAKNAKAPSKNPKKPQALLTTILHCGCREKMYRYTVRNGDRYRCNSVQRGCSCKTPSLPLGLADEAAIELFMSSYGEREMTRKVWQSGNDPAEEIAQIDAELDSVVKLAGSFRGRQLEVMQTRVEALNERRSVLQAQEVVPAGYRYEPTGETVSEHYERLSHDERAQFLRDIGLMAVWNGSYFAVLLKDDRVLPAVNPSEEAGNGSEVYVSYWPGLVAGEQTPEIPVEEYSQVVARKFFGADS